MRNLVVINHENRNIIPHFWMIRFAMLICLSLESLNSIVILILTGGLSIKMLTTVILRLSFDILNHSDLFLSWFLIVKLLLSLLPWKLVCYFRGCGVLLASILVSRGMNLTLRVILQSKFFQWIPEWTTQIFHRLWIWFDLVLRKCLVTTRGRIWFQ